MRPVVRAQRRNRERERDAANLPDRFDVEPRRQESFRIERHGDARRLEFAAGHHAEPRPHPVFQHVERLPADDDELHEVRRVGALVEIDQLVADRGAGAVREGLRGADQEPRERMTRIESLLPCGVPAHPVAAQPRDELRVHDLSLALDVLAVEAGGDEELGEAVERAFEVRGVDVEEVARVGERRRGVAGAAVLGEKAAVLPGVRILLGAEKQHVLHEVREPRPRVRIVAATHVDVERRRGLVRVGVGDDQGLEPVVEHDGVIVPGVGGAAFDPGAVRGHDARHKQDECRYAGTRRHDLHAEALVG